MLVDQILRFALSLNHHHSNQFAITFSYLRISLLSSLLRILRLVLRKCWLLRSALVASIPLACIFSIISFNNLNILFRLLLMHVFHWSSPTFIIKSSDYTTVSCHSLLQSLFLKINVTQPSFSYLLLPFTLFTSIRNKDNE